MTDLPQTFVLMFETSDCWQIVELPEKAWKKLSPTLATTRVFLDTGVYRVKCAKWLGDDEQLRELRVWHDRQAELPF